MSPPNQKASLGCGTLILIALIVMIFGNANRGNDTQLTSQIQNLQSQLRDLTSSVNGLKHQIQEQSGDLTKIQKSLDEINKRSTQVRPRVVAVPSSSDAPAPRPPLETPLPEN
jgi:TolA-binding protein